MAGKDSRRRFGQINKMRSGRWQARFTVPLGHPSGRGGQVVTAPHTFEANTYGREAAGDWLRAEELRLNAEGASWRTLVEHAEEDRIRAAAQTVPTFAEYAEVWLRARKVKGQPLQESTKRGYLIWLGKYLLPTFGEMPLNTITAADVVRWYEGLPHRQGEDRARVLRARQGDLEVCDCRGRRAPRRRQPVHHRRRRHHRQTIGQAN